jgi:ribonuclease VapC
VIVLDTSALVAILFDEPERAAFLAIIADAPGPCLLSALTLYETRLVTRAKGGLQAVSDLGELLMEIRPDVVPFDEGRALAAEAACMRYGKGIHSIARLNLVDCAAYALAIERSVPLLFKGADFTATDVLVAR